MRQSPEKELDIFELELAVKWAHAASLMDANTEVSYLFALSETALKEKLERLKSASPDTDPLTLEELREMDGEPVWISYFAGGPNVCMLVDAKHDVFRDAHGGFAVFENLGRTWIAYRRKPEEGTT